MEEILFDHYLILVVAAVLQVKPNFYFDGLPWIPL